jgi:two-component system, cell cycle response regulator DivK
MSKRILVVEDQADNRQIIRDMLAPTDYEITEAEDGEQALAALAKERPDLVLMGIQLPIMDGYEVTRQIKADEPSHFETIPYNQAGSASGRLSGHPPRTAGA